MLPLFAPLLLVDGAAAQWNATEEAQLIPSSASQASWTGASVALSGDTAVVGAPQDSVAGRINIGAAFVYVRTGTTWTEQAKLTVTDAQAWDRFGSSVAIDGDRIVIGARHDVHTPGANGSAAFGPGAAYVFERIGTTWSERARLTASDAEPRDEFGTTVSMGGGTILIGAPEDVHAAGSIGGSTGEGSAYLFVGSGST